jgi:hypothetical protein
VTAAVGAVDDMVQLESAAGPAAVDAATAAVSAPDEARDAGRNVLVGTLGCGAVDRSDVLGVAEGALDDAWVDGDLRARAFLPALLTAAAEGEGNLELRAAGGLAGRGTVEDGVAQRGDDGVIGEVLTVLVVEDRAGLAEERVRFGVELEAHDVWARLGIGRVVGVVAGTVVGDEVFDLADVLAGGAL